MRSHALFRLRLGRPKGSLDYGLTRSTRTRVLYVVLQIIDVPLAEAKRLHSHAPDRITLLFIKNICTVWRSVIKTGPPQ